MNGALDHHTAGNQAKLGGSEYIAHLCDANYFLSHLGGQHTRQSGPHVINQIINDVVVTDLNTLALRCGARFHISSCVEANDNGRARHGQTDIGLRDTTNTP